MSQTPKLATSSILDTSLMSESVKESTLPTTLQQSSPQISGRYFVNTLV